MDQPSDQDERARRRDEREQDLIGRLALIAPSEDLLREVVALTIGEDAAEGSRPASQSDTLVASESRR
jgi:hypothetical protein